MIYPIVFDVEEESSTSWATWLDLAIHKTTLFITMKPRKFLLPKLLDKGTTLVRSVLIGLVQRLSEVPMTYEAKLDVLISVIQKAKQSGVKDNIVRCAVFGAKRTHPQNLIKALQMITTKLFAK